MRSGEKFSVKLGHLALTLFNNPIEREMLVMPDIERITKPYESKREPIEGAWLYRRNAPSTVTGGRNKIVLR